MKPAAVVESPPQTFDIVPDRGPLGTSRLVSLWTAYALTLRQHLHGKRWMVIAGMCVLCAGLVILVRVTAPDAAPVMLEFNFAFMFIPQAMLPLLALIYASGI